MNVYAPYGLVIWIAAVLVLLAFKLRRPFCEQLCPIGTLSSLLLKIEGLPSVRGKMQDTEEE